MHIMSGYGGGISSFIANKARELADSELQFSVMTFDEVPETFKDLIEDTGGKIYRISNPKQEGFIRFFKQVKAILEKSGKKTVVHSHVNGTIALPFFLVAKVCRISRFVIHAHTSAPLTDSNGYKDKIKRTLNNFMSKERLSCGIEATKNIFGNQATKSDAVMHIPNSIDYKRFERLNQMAITKTELLGLSNDTFLIGHIGRFKSVKNHEFMLEIAASLVSKRVDFKWVFAGDGLLFDDIKRMAKEKELDDYLIFLGRREDIPELLSVLDRFVLPSFYEGLPTVIIESQAACTPAILSDSITKECDLGLGLVNYLPINSTEMWADKIIGPQNVKPNQPLIEEKIKKLNFTNEASANLYRRFILGEKKTYNILKGE